MADNPIRPLLRRSAAAIMGIINATPDSFSDGGQFPNVAATIDHALRLVKEGADILDVGGESTRPGAKQVSAQQELDRVIPVIEALSRRISTPISVDTYKPEVMRAAIEAGAHMVNDVNGLRADGAVEAVANLNVPVCVMHMQGQPQTMQTQPSYTDVVTEVLGFFQQRVQICTAAGLARGDIVLDPGIGFGKTLDHNLILLNRLAQIKADTGCELLIGVSRKSLIQKQLGRSVTQRLPASLALAVQSVLNGAKIVRVHDVRASFDAIRMAEAVRDAV